MWIKREVMLCQDQKLNLEQGSTMMQLIYTQNLGNIDSKIKLKQMMKFNKLSSKPLGYMYNNTFGYPDDTNTSDTLVTNASTTTTNSNHTDDSTTTTSTITTTTTTISNQSNITTTITNNNKWVISLSSTP